jgi:hypothetical protein
MNMENIEKKIDGLADSLADVLGIPKDVQEELKRMSIIQTRISTCLHMNKAISRKDMEEFNRMCYKHFSRFQDGSEFEKEEPEERPKECPKPADTIDFAGAIRSVKQGYRCARKGWNGKGQYIQLACNISYMTKGGDIVNPTHANIGNSAIAFIGTSGTQIGWLASQADMLADDWYMV